VAPDPRNGDAPQVVNHRRGPGEHNERPEVIKAVPIRHWGRWIASVVILYIFVALLYSLAKNPAIQWSTIGDYLFRPLVLQGALRTLELTFIAMVIGIIGGTILAVMRLSDNYVLSWLSWLYIWFFRGTPVFVQILIWGYFGILYHDVFVGLPFTGLVFGDIETNRLIGGFVAAILALGLNEAAYAAELVRAGIISVDRGQYEAAQSLGMSPALTMRRVILPQAMRVIIPPMGNETISMLKTTALVSVISGKELMTNVTTIYSQNFKIVPLLFVACIWYIFFTTLLTIGQHYLERHYGKGFGEKETESAEKRALKRLQQKGGDVNEPGNF
jgi:His/Glu/Gln/Arg/opine family amino acid ABC transporter permease subunit